MIAQQRLMTEKILFDHYMISSICENQIHTPYPYYLDKSLFDQMVNSAEILNSLVLRIMDTVLQNPEDIPFCMGFFPFKKDILSLKCALSPVFWVRYDAFVRADGGIFFSEFNYDKPCAQREIAISDWMNPLNNPNTHFRQAFFDNFAKICKPLYYKISRPVVAILVSPLHEEEVHLAHFYMDLLKGLELDFIITGTDNLSVRDDRVYAFDKPVDILLRQFPTEYMHQIADFKNILSVYEAGNIQIVNDPRIIIAQTKSLFAYLWQLVEQNSSFLQPIEKETIQATIPHTRLFDALQTGDLYTHKDIYVIKAVYGRYS